MERGLVHTSPGTTALQFSHAAAQAVPEFTARLVESGELFDAVRYLEQPGSRGDYDRLLQLERELRASRPAGADLANSALTGSAPETDAAPRAEPQA